MLIFDFESYKTYLLDRVHSMPREGHGQFTKMAKHLAVTPVTITQVLKGPRHFTEEQGLRVTSYFGLKTDEVEYFMRLLALEKAGTSDLKTYHRTALQALRKTAYELRNRVGEFRELDEAAKSVFYSDWIYSAIRLLTSIPEYQTVDAIAERFELGREAVSGILSFLTQVGLCKQDSEGRFQIGVGSTHVPASSRFANLHRRNWRLKGLEGLNRATPDDVFYSGPCTLSQKDFEELKREIVAVIASLTKRAPKSEPSVLACLNIDWFKL